MAMHVLAVLRFDYHMSHESRGEWENHASSDGGA